MTEAMRDAERIDDFIQASEANLPYELPLSSLAPMIIRAIMAGNPNSSNSGMGHDFGSSHQQQQNQNNNNRKNNNQSSTAANTSSTLGPGVKSMEQLFNMFPQLGNCMVCPKGSLLASEQQKQQQNNINNNNMMDQSTSSSHHPHPSSMSTSSAYLTDNNYRMMFDTPMQNARNVVESIFRFFFVTSALVRKIRQIIHALGEVEISPTMTNTINDLARPLADAEEMLKEKAKTLLGKDFENERLLFDKF